MFEDYLTQDLKQDEEVVVIFRKSWGSRLASILKIILFLAIPLVFSFVLLTHWLGGIIFTLLLLWAVFYALYVWMNWYFDSVVITNQRIIKVSQKGLFNRAVEEFPLDHVGNVSYEIPGFLATFFKYGTLKIEMDYGKKTDLECLSGPRQTQDLLIELARLARKKISAEELIEFISRVKWDVYKREGGLKKKEKIE